MKRNTDLTPSQTEQTAITNLVNKIQAVLDGLIVSPGNFDACVSSLSSSQPNCVQCCTSPASLYFVEIYPAGGPIL